MTTEAADAHWIEMNIAVNAQGRSVLVMQHRFKPPLKEGTNSPIEPVEPSAIGQVQPLDCLTQVSLGRASGPADDNGFPSRRSRGF